MRQPRGAREQDDRATLAALHQLGKALLAAGGPEEVAQTTVRHVRDLAAAQFASLILFDPATAQAEVAATFAESEGLRGSRWDRDAFGPVDAFADGTPLIYEDAAEHASLPPAVGALARGGIRSLVEVPLVVGDGLVGLIVVGASDPGSFSSAHIAGLGSTAELVGPAVVRAGAELRESARAGRAERMARSLERSLNDHRRLLSQVAMSQEQARQRLAVDIHDDSVQVMTAAGMRLQTMRERVRDEDMRREIDEIHETVRMATDRLRHLMFELVPPTLEREGLGPALSLYLERVREDAGLSYVFESGVHGQAPAETRTALYRIAQEAVRNIVEHAGASRIELDLDRRQGGIWIRIRDDGGGFSLQEVESRLPLHIGLTAMRQHAELAGGWCRVHSVPGEGTTVEAWVPGEPVEAIRTDDVSASTA